MVWGEDQASPRRHRDRLFRARRAAYVDLRSVSKSVACLLYGIAPPRRHTPPPEARRLYDQRSRTYPDLAAQPGRDRLTVHHVLSMTLGLLDWHELTIPYGDPRNSETAMEMAP